MKTFVAIAALAAASQMPAAQAWWDNGHMLVGEVAAQLMAPEDVTTIQTVLKQWNNDFPNTDRLSTAAIWPDLIKCSKRSDICQSYSVNAFSSMGDWHYVDLPLDIAGGKWGGMNSDDLALFNYSLGGNAIDVLERSMSTIQSTNSTWSTNLIIRNFIHIFGDLHQPLHAVAGINKDLPEGDNGGNSFVFQTPCQSSNLHGLWDSAGGLLSQNNWGPELATTEKSRPALEANATALIGFLPLITDAVNLDAYKSLDYKTFQSKFSADKIFRRVVQDSYALAGPMVYKPLDLTFSNKKVACPSQAYHDWVGTFSQYRIAVGGKRLAVILTQFAKQIKANNVGKLFA